MGDGGRHCRPLTLVWLYQSAGSSHIVAEMRRNRVLIHEVVSRWRPLAQRTAGSSDPGIAVGPRLPLFSCIKLASNYQLPQCYYTVGIYSWMLLSL